MLEKLWDWIQCNIMGKFSDKYKKKCFTSAVVLSQEDEIKLDSADPGSLGEALWELKVDQKRQTEDYNRANEALSRLQAAIISQDAPAIFYDSDEVEMAEEALFWRAWITAQTSQMTHNMVNMEICDADGKVIDYMDLAATGLDKDGQLISDNRDQNRNPNGFKSGKDFRWSNRCKNTSDITFTTSTSCPEPIVPLPPPLDPKEYWIEERVNDLMSTKSGDNTCTNNECLDPSGSEKRETTNDIQTFNLGNFSGYNCKLYETLYCQEGYPDYDNFADMFGMKYNWPELNCCACGGGSRTNVNSDTKSKNKYEFISMIPTNIDYKENNFDYDEITYNLETPSASGSMIDCIKSCNAPENDSCLGIVFENCGYDPTNAPYTAAPPRAPALAPSAYTEGTDTDVGVLPVIPSTQPSALYNYFNPHNFQRTSTNMEDAFLYNPGTCRLISGNDGGNLFNRNFKDNKIYGTDQFTDTQFRLLKKMPSNFQNFDIDGKTMSSEEINSSDLKNYSIKYDKPIKNLPAAAGPVNIDKCNILCANLDGYKIKLGSENIECGDEGCKRSECCTLDTSYRDDILSTKNTLIGNINPSTIVNNVNAPFCGRLGSSQDHVPIVSTQSDGGCTGANAGCSYKCINLEIHTGNVDAEDIGWSIGMGEALPGAPEYKEEYSKAQPYENNHSYTESLCLADGPHLLSTTDTIGDGWGSDAYWKITTSDGITLAGHDEHGVGGLVSGHGGENIFHVR